MHYKQTKENQISKSKPQPPAVASDETESFPNKAAATCPASNSGRTPNAAACCCADDEIRDHLSGSLTRS
ncbi:hypothetical protein AXF42_Ash021445 [Apostasia shenzhenica]|uniref:Uncharacterized protein n=1 Tax=Apostasia shenzhenica TaxID=1088818 RepID=A0A2H9ZXL1_9ASPA|nr:hypothetical protein AXF42_Ash021445 [Apostasia shenzhenica]